jgi:hypothetical protein
LVESVPTARLLLLVSYRPEYQHGWGSKTYYTQVRLDPMPPASADEFLQALLGDDSSLAPLRHLLIVRTEGNAFFLEESVCILVETGVLIGVRGDYRLMQDLPTVQVPATVYAVLAARIDRLPPDDKWLLQTAAVIGTDVPLPLLQAVIELPKAVLQRALTHAMACGDVTSQVVICFNLGWAYATMGDYGRAIDLHRSLAAFVKDDVRSGRASGGGFMSVLCRNALASSLAECGAFAESLAHGEEGIPIAETSDHPGSLARIYSGVGRISAKETSRKRSRCLNGAGNSARSRTLPSLPLSSPETWARRMGCPRVLPRPCRCWSKPWRRATRWDTWDSQLTGSSS